MDGDCTMGARTFRRRPHIPISPLRLPGFGPQNTASEGSGSKRKPRRPYIHISPLKLPEFGSQNRAQDSSDSKRKTIAKRPYIPLKPLNLSLLTPSEEQPLKKRKIERPVRKELFKEPKTKATAGSRQKFGYKARISGVTKVEERPLFKTVLFPIKEPKKQRSASPSQDFEFRRLEKSLESAKNVVKIVLSPMSPIKETSPPDAEGSCTPENTQLKTRNSSGRASDLEFLRLEKSLASAKKVTKSTLSPMSSVCSLLQNANISSEKSLSQIVKEEVEAFQRLKQHMLQFEKEHEERMNLILAFVGQKEGDKENKELKNVLKASKDVDLRKQTLSKSLPASFASQTPRTRKAMAMYNDLRGNCSVLCTPQVEMSGLARSLSTTIQQQCLLLQDTPKHS